MSIIETAVRRPVTILVIVFLVILFGLLGLTSVPVQLTPNVEPPVITITTTWFGADPQEIVREIVEEQEEVLKRVTGVEEMTAIARPGQAEIRLEFPPGGDKEAALNEVRDKLRQVPEYPENVDEPVVESVDAASREYMAWIMVEPLPTNPDADGDGRPDPIASDGANAPGFDGNLRELGDFFNDEVKPVLERAPGVEQINIFGGLEREMQVRVDLERLAARGIGIDRLVDVLRQSNQNVTAGTVDEGKRSVSVRVTGQFQDPKSIESTVLTYDDGGAPVFVRDVAEVELGFKKEVGFVRSKGVPVMAINALRETGTNALVVMENLKGAIADANENVISPQGWGLQMRQLYDETVYINDALDTATSNLLMGALLASAVLFLTLRSVGATAVIATAIPVSIFGTFLGMSILGRSLNVISLAGLTFAIGMGIDNAIVVLENIFRHREIGKDRFKAAIDGAGEVWGAIVASTLTNVVVFLPIIFIEEEAGQLFRDLSVALTISFFFYLFISPTLIPMLASLFLRKMPAGLRHDEDTAPQTRLGRITRPIGRVQKRLSDGFYNLVLWLTHGLAIRLALVVVLVGAAFATSYFLMPPRDYLPAGNQNLFFGLVLPPPGYSVDEYRNLAQHVESQLAPWWSIDTSTEEGRAELARLQAEYQQGIEQGIEQTEQQLRASGADDAAIAAATSQQRAMLETLENSPPPPAIENFFFGNFGNFVFMGAASQDRANVAALSGPLNDSVQGIPGTNGFFAQAPIFNTGGGFGSGNSITLKVIGDDNDTVVAASGAVMGKLMEVFNDFPLPDPNNFNLGRSEIRIDPARERAALAKVPEASIRSMAQVAVDGQIIGDYRYGGRAIDLSVLTSRPRDETYTEDLSGVPLATIDGSIVPLASVADFIRSTAPQQINRTEEQNSVSFTINLPPTVSVGEATKKIYTQVEEPLRAAGVLPPGVRLDLTGSAAKLQSFMLAFLPGLLLAALVTYLLLAALLESFIYPIAIILSVPFALAGGLLGLAILHWFDPQVKLDVLTMLGFVILIGTIVNNPILIVYQALNFIRDGMEWHEAIAHSAQTRVRPIFMSVVTTIAGLAPLVIFAGAGSELYRGLGAVIIGGLAVSTVLTLLLTPALMSLLMDVMTLLSRPVTRQVPSAPETVEVTPTSAPVAQPVP